MNWIRNNLTLVAGLALPPVALLAFLAVTRLPAEVAGPPAEAPVVVVKHAGTIEAAHLWGEVVLRDGVLVAKVRPNDNNYTQVDRVFVGEPEGGQVREITVDWPTQAPASPREFVIAGSAQLDIRPGATSTDGYRLVWAGHERPPLIGQLYKPRRDGFDLARGTVIHHYRLPDNLRYHQVQLLGWVAQ